jgi:hypothetical protein
MTKRLSVVGFAAVAVVWGPFLYSELARKPLPAAEPEPVVVNPTPVAFEDRAQLQAALVQHRQAELAAAQEQQAAQERLAALAAAKEQLAAAEQPAVAEPAAEPSKESEQPPTAAGAETTVAAASAAAPGQPAEPALHAPVQPPPLAANDPAAREHAPAEAASPNGAPAARDEAAPAEEAAKQPAEAAKDDAKPAEPEAHAKAEEPATPESLAPAFRSAFDRESRDAQWASTEEPRLTQLLTSAGVPATAIADVQCQATVCRIALNSVDAKSPQQSPLYQLLYQRVRDEFGPMLGMDTGQNGEQHAAFYVLRKGYELERARETN